MLAVEQYFNMAPSPGPMPLGNGAGSPRDYTCNGLDAFKPRVHLQHVVQLDLHLLTDLAINNVLLHVLKWVILPTVELTEPLQPSLQRHFPWLTKNSTLTPVTFTFVFCQHFYFVWPVTRKKNSAKI